MGSVSKIGRNDSCPCGSGKKYKRCCLNSLSAPTNEPTQKFESRRDEYVLTPQRLINKARRVFRGMFRQVDPSEVIMPEAILYLVKDLLEECITYQEKYAAVAIACFAWNLVVAMQFNPDDDVINDLFDKILASKTETDELLQYLMGKKVAHYRDVDRIVLDFDLVQKTNGPHLTITSAPITEESEYLSEQLIEKLEKAYA